jgi:hypothetical protein
MIDRFNIQINGLFAPWQRFSRFLRLEIFLIFLRLKKRSRLASEQKSSLIEARRA